MRGGRAGALNSALKNNKKKTGSGSFGFLSGDSKSSNANS